ncbi:MAG: nucleotidyltransferase substrate binding protein [Deltaproteobacteria bacterium]|nr:nucleotidyltransferase substrate binding protein [Deltaproteobacteria bacterium]MBI4224586.1 nucleotidyltransferase substrate binding protein [Deltaproteobacteria bacterium]
MESKGKTRLPKAARNLEEALENYKANPAELNFLTISKAFEILVEYAWRLLKEKVEDQGLEAPSPKMAVKEAARLKLISEPEIWLDCIDARNDSVHNYFGISKQEYVRLAGDFLRLAQKNLSV